MNRVLLTVSGVIDPAGEEQIAAGRKPRTDYLEMARAFGADLIDYTQARQSSGSLGRLLEKVGGPDLLLAWACFKRRRNYQVIFTDGEQVGIPFALMCKLRWGSRSRHLMIVHILSVKKKLFFFDLFGLQSQIDTFIVYSMWQQRFIEQRLKIPRERIVFTPFMVDASFFSLERVRPNPRHMICAVGLEFRDYPTLLEAVDGLDVEVIIAAASPWSKRADTTSGAEIPSNVKVQRYSQYDLRQIYANSRFMVMPLYDVNFQAGVTAILEAMAMERAVICSRTQGQTDIVVEDETGLYVPPGDAGALRTAIIRLLANAREAERMGKAGRTRVERELDLDHYVARLHTLIQNTLQAHDDSYERQPQSIES